MNGVHLVIITACVLILAYRFYGAFIAAKVLTLNQYNVPPSIRLEDGHDYVPTNKWVVFGHHLPLLRGQVRLSVRLSRRSSVICRA